MARDPHVLGKPLGCLERKKILILLGVGVHSKVFGDWVTVWLMDMLVCLSAILDAV